MKYVIPETQHMHSRKFFIVHWQYYDVVIYFFFCNSIISHEEIYDVNPSPAEPGYTLTLQTV